MNKVKNTYFQLKTKELLSEIQQNGTNTVKFLNEYF